MSEYENEMKWKPILFQGLVTAPGETPDQNRESEREKNHLYHNKKTFEMNQNNVKKVKNWFLIMLINEKSKNWNFVKSEIIWK